MPCCSTILQTFANESVTIVPFTGDQPTVTVSYLIDGVWYAMGVATNILLGVADITVSHGGASTGVVKVIN